MKFLICLFFLLRILTNGSCSLRSIVMRQNEKMFKNFPIEPRYYEKEKYTAKLKIETLLNLIYLNFVLKDSGLLNELKANYLNSYLTNDQFFVDLNEARIYKYLNRTWYKYCSVNYLKCKRLCLKKDVINSYKKHWCLDNQSNRFKRSLLDNNASKSDLIDEILSEFSQANLKNNIVYIKSLADSLKTKPVENKMSQSVQIEIDECQKAPCDTNADCINTIGSYKCKCKSGFVGSGRQGGCYNGKFCSGRYCRENGECYFKDTLNGYKCKCALKCLNGGRCVMTKFKYECACPRNVTGFLCNETFEYNVFKQRLIQKFGDMNTSDSIILSELIKFVEPESDQLKLMKFYKISSAGLKKFEILDFLKKHLQNFEKNSTNLIENSDDSFKKKALDLIHRFMPFTKFYHTKPHDHFLNYLY